MHLSLTALQKCSSQVASTCEFREGCPGSDQKSTWLISLPPAVTPVTQKDRKSILSWHLLPAVIVGLQYLDLKMSSYLIFHMFFFFSPLIVKDQFDFCKLFTTETSCGTSLASQRVVRRNTFLPSVTWLDIPWFLCWIENNYFGLTFSVTHMT